LQGPSCAASAGEGISGAVFFHKVSTKTKKNKQKKLKIICKKTKIQFSTPSITTTPSKEVQLPNSNVIKGLKNDRVCETFVYRGRIHQYI
jgi:hypothetical protein